MKGYGNIYPEVRKECGLANFFGVIESFVGVLYAGFCGAIMFGKVSNVYSRATVIFSNVCVVRYGRGIFKNNSVDDDDEDDDNVDDDGKTKTMVTPRNEGVDVIETPGIFKERSTSLMLQRLRCPILLFRIVNQKANGKDGNLLNLNLNAVSIIEIKTGEDGAAGLRRQFRSLDIQPQSVSIFDRTLYVGHILNEDSPLLNMKTRRLIKRNKAWPADLNTHEKIRGVLEFQQIVISLEAISASSKSTVYADKTYPVECLKIGWKFVDMTYKVEGNSSSPYHVDLSLVNRIMEQEGGGGEPVSG